MILVTTGTNEQPFDRLVRAAAALRVGEPLVVQHGSSRVAPGPGTWVEYLPFNELAELARAARVVVSHAGVGSIMLARRAGKRAIVLPRRLHLGEAVDDHQLTLARRFHASGAVTLIEDAAILPAAVMAAGEPGGQGGAVHLLPGAAALSADLRTAISGFGARAA